MTAGCGVEGMGGGGGGVWILGGGIACAKFSSKTKMNQFSDKVRK